MKKFEIPEMEIEKFAVADILTTSSSYCPVNIVDEDELPPVPVG